MVEISFYAYVLNSRVLFSPSNIAHCKHVLDINIEGKSYMHGKLFKYFGEKRGIDTVGM